MLWPVSAFVMRGLGIGMGWMMIPLAVPCDVSKLLLRLCSSFER